jgi:hypothetical protein
MAKILVFLKQILKTVLASVVFVVGQGIHLTNCSLNYSYLIFATGALYDLAEGNNTCGAH